LICSGEALTESLNSVQTEIRIEKNIIEAFGDSIIEFETALFHKYLISSGPNSLVTRMQFGKHLMRMYAKGYLVPLQFHKRRAWKRLIVADFVDQDVILTESSEPIKTEPLVIPSPQENSEKVHEHLVTDCKDIAEEIISTIKMQRKFGTDQKAKALLHEHISKMHHALTESREHFYSYIDSYLPSLREPFEQMLKSRGDDKVLLGLRVIQSVP
jgi:hypothetical protein